MKILNEFRKFALRGNLVDMAVGFTVGAAFTSVAKSVVDDLIMPVVAWLAGGADFSGLYVVLAPGAEHAGPYSSLLAAREAGAITINYGLFINSLFAFFLVALVMFFIVRSFNRIEESLEEQFGSDATDPDELGSKKCFFCRTQIPAKAIRCPNCTSELEGTGIMP